jgi:hypothetical protein
VATGSNENLIQTEVIKEEEKVNETREEILKTWGNINSKCIILPSNGDFSHIKQFITDPTNTILALDFDQTITIKVIYTLRY